jgi:hypothetical protein
MCHNSLLLLPWQAEVEQATRAGYLPLLPTGPAEVPFSVQDASGRRRDRRHRDSGGRPPESMELRFLHCARSFVITGSGKGRLNGLASRWSLHSAARAPLAGYLCSIGIAMDPGSRRLRIAPDASEERSIAFASPKQGCEFLEGLRMPRRTVSSAQVRGRETLHVRGLRGQPTGEVCQDPFTPVFLSRSRLA